MLTLKYFQGIPEKGGGGVKRHIWITECTWRRKQQRSGVNVVTRVLGECGVNVVTRLWGECCDKALG